MAKANGSNDSDFNTLIKDTEKLLKSKKMGHIFPLTAFDQSNSDDIELFSASMLADIAIYSAEEINSWGGRTPRVIIDDIPGIKVEGEQTSVISVISQNKPFLYDSIIGEITNGARQIHMALHPILVKDEDGHLALRNKRHKPAQKLQISYIQIHLPKLSKADAVELKKRINHVLKQVTQAVNGWKPMLTKLDQAIAGISNIPGSIELKKRQEAVAFLNWLREENFTFLGMREYSYSKRGKKAELKYDGKNGLGILSDPKLAVLRLGTTPVISTPEIIAFLNGKDHLLVTKANVRSVVHRRTYMDCIGIKKYDAKGNVCGELRVIGLFTSSAYNHSVTKVPVLREKMHRVTTKFGFDENSHSGKSLLNTLESYPRDELFQISAKQLYEFCVQINDMEDRPRVRVLTRIDRFDRFVSIIVYVPRHQYNSLSREKIGLYLKAIYGDRVSAYYPAFPTEGVARVHFIIGRSGGKTPILDQKLIEQDIKAIATRWEDKFADLAKDEKTRIEVNQSYMEHFTAEETFADLDHLKACTSAGEMRVIFMRRPIASDDQLSIKIFHARKPLSLSRRVPLLENMGFGVTSEHTLEIDVRDKDNQLQTVVIHDMELELPQGAKIDLDKDHDRLEDAFLTVWSGEVDNDPFNRLITQTNLTISEIKVLRAYARYLKQAGVTYSQRYMAECLIRYPKITAYLFDLFNTRFDPSHHDEIRETELSNIQNNINIELETVPSLDDDQIIKRFSNIIWSTLRSNYFQIMQNGARNPILAFKFDPNAIEGLPEPVPFREIFVYGADVEGLHLRFGPVARGGLRWSDRGEDYRTEVLGLVKAQQVKNAVIVPVGSKGGFYPKQLPAGGDRDAIFNAGREAYKLFISTMLSITDNLTGAKVIPPKNTIRHDGDDPYFVVAADKGTATFSDTANAISQEHGFWLDDAFASGGSAGYDHKKMGITAKGAWEAVKRHFREMNTDIQSEPFTVSGVGDMSGDVFGNGMLLSRKICLKAAFDHRDIFIDPDPDCDTSFIERKRLFELDRSSWQSYDTSLLSKGGMIISRQEKSVNLTKEVADFLQINGKNVSPHDILRAILKAPVDLLWFGGIGTYIRDVSENDAEVGDRANDPIRIIATEVGAKVIGEGANLGITQEARIAYAASGGRCNSDAIDNSAGVNSSDVEVNIKIALANAMREDRLTLPKRNRLLSSMTNDVSKLVLRNNYLQTLAISLVERNGVAAGDELARLMSTLEADGLLNRTVETLPDDQEMQERLAAGKSLTRPEIGVLLSYSKIVLFDEVIASSLPDDTYFNDTLNGYFPKKMLTNHLGDIESHRLKREIISTVIINDAINRGGPSYISRMQEHTGASASDIVKSYILSRDGLFFNQIFAAIDALDNRLGGHEQNMLYFKTCNALIKTSSWAIKTNAFAGDLSTSVIEMQKAFDALSPKITDHLPEFISTHIEQIKDKLLSLSVPKKLAKDIAELETRVLIPEINQVATTTKTDLEKTAATFFAITETLQIGKILTAADNATMTDHYDILALSRSLNEISQARRTMTINALEAFAKKPNPAKLWAEQNNVKIVQAASLINDIIESGQATAAKLTIASGVINDLARS
ncbi:NAD-glutamate dehydrogenase [Lentilitoribacter sp. EG35]|uniref:NAD-glutamate dehydrogenase n=1 Tax=Lentilitoribacter sp. EG35 TaxID=3234192 RepID=UPI00346034C8